MAGQICGRLAAAADLLRPRTFFRTLSRVDAIADKTRELSAAVDALRIQNEQLLTIQRVDWDKRFDIARLDRSFDEKEIARHVNAAFEAAPLELTPFPHLIVENWLPRDV